MTIVSLTVACFAGLAFIPKVPGSIILDDNNSIYINYQNISWRNESRKNLSAVKYFINII